MASSSKWDTGQVPDQSGRVAVVTGSTSGIGMEAAKALAAKNATVILAARNADKAGAVIDEARARQPDADMHFEQLELTSLQSVKDFAARIAEKHARLDLLVNNAGIMMCPYGTTEDGFELQFGTNHLGHFALTGHLLPLLKSTAGSRVVVVSSLAHRRGNLDFTDLNWQRRKYNSSQAYCDSKLANLLFANELARRLATVGGCPLVTAAHPGWTQTDLQRHARIFSLLNPFVAQKTAMGALPTLRAAIDKDAGPGDYFGPGGRSEMRGYPVKVECTEIARDEELGAHLWELSEQMTGVTYDFSAADTIA